MEQPLVSVLIPVTGNGTHIELALTSVLLQTYTNLEIIIRDDTSTDHIQRVIEKEFLSYSNRIVYIKEPMCASRVETLQRLIELSTGAYINIMMEKDLFYPTKIERMMEYFLQDDKKEIQLITSNVVCIDRNGNKEENTGRIHNQDVQWDTTLIYNLILKYPNYIGGISVPLFRKQGLIEGFGSFANRICTIELELASWLTLASQGTFVFLEEELTFERKKIKDKEDKVILNRMIDWVHVLNGMKQKKYRITTGTKNYVIKRIVGWMDDLLGNKQHTLTLQDREKIKRYKEYIDGL